MTSLIEKARLGRMNALAALPFQSRNRASERPELGRFISSRARMAADAVLA